MRLKRSSGVLLHITSLPGPWGIGTMGQEARLFADFCHSAGFSYWQILPLNPVSEPFHYSPYSTCSAFAINPLFISLIDLAAEAWFTRILPPVSVNESYRVDFSSVSALYDEILPLAYNEFRANAQGEIQNACSHFTESQSWWLDDYALFTVMAREYDSFNWHDWPEGLRNRNKKALLDFTADHREALDLEKFIQFVCQEQWKHLKSYCAQRQIALIGDIPMYVSLESSDAWSGHDFLALDPKTGAPESVAGVPPDYFSETGQRWGNPVYRWFTPRGKLNEATLSWWIKRIERLVTLVDIIRVDHFRAFSEFWAIDPDCETALDGTWEKGPGLPFFAALRLACGELPLIAEDLGIITDDVTVLRDTVGLPGMKILQFAFDGNSENLYLPHGFENTNTVLYSGTHDNNTLNGWYYGKDISDWTRNYVAEYTGADTTGSMHWKLIRLAMRSVSRLVIFPLQDILGFGEEHRMNQPGTVQGNWIWKSKKECFSDELAASLRRMNEIYSRLPDLSSSMTIAST